MTCDGESWAKSQMLVSAQLPRTANLEMHKLEFFLTFTCVLLGMSAMQKRDTLNSRRSCFPTIWPLFESLEMQWGMLFFHPSIKMFAISIKRMYTIQPCRIVHRSRRLLGLFQFVEPLTKVCDLNVGKIKNVTCPQNERFPINQNKETCVHILASETLTATFFFPPPSRSFQLPPTVAKQAR